MDTNVLSKLADMHEVYSTPKELATILDVTTRTLSRWHSQGEGPPRIKKHKLILYKLSSVRDWLESFEQKPVR